MVTRRQTRSRKSERTTPLKEKYCVVLEKRLENESTEDSTKQ